MPLLVRWRLVALLRSCPPKRSLVQPLRLASYCKRLWTFVPLPSQRETSLLDPTGSYGFITSEHWPWGIEVVSMVPASKRPPTLPSRWISAVACTTQANRLVLTGRLNLDPQNSRAVILV
jgi:hypothetical protein